MQLRQAQVGADTRKEFEVIVAIAELIDVGLIVRRRELPLALLDKQYNVLLQTLNRLLGGLELDYLLSTLPEVAGRAHELALPNAPEDVITRAGF